MGLDMYLFRRSKEPVYDEDGRQELGERVMYWRKANQIRAWLVNSAGYDEGANCEPYVLDEDDLACLRDDCRFVLDNHPYAVDVLPTSCGFFFGSEDYDETYFEQIEDTYNILDELLATTNFDEQEIVYYEWW